MIIVTLSEDKFAYDIHSLVKAFYPAQDVKVFVEGEKELNSDAGLPAFFVRFEEDRITAGYSLDQESASFVCKTEDPQDRPAVKNSLKQLLYGMYRSQILQRMHSSEGSYNHGNLEAPDG